MADYSQYKTETLFKKLIVAHEEYYRLALTPCADGRNFSKTPEGKELERALKRYEAICDELEKRGHWNTSSRVNIIFR